MQFFYKNKNILPLLDVLQHPLFYRQKRLEILVSLCAMIFSFFELSKIFDFCYHLCTSFFYTIKILFWLDFSQKPHIFQRTYVKYTNNFINNYILLH
jgi:hypothetical protein